MNKTIAFYHQSDKNVMVDRMIDNNDDTNEYVRLTNELRALDYEVHTLDVYRKKSIEPDICIFLDVPIKPIQSIIDVNKTKSMVLLREAEMISQINYDVGRHHEFDIILTWKRAFIDNKKYFFFPSTRFVLSNKIEVDDYKSRKLCTLINSNLSSNIKGELYSHRVNAIEWFEKSHLEDFDLWGYGWDEHRISIKNRTILKSKILAKKRTSYRGMANDKLETLSQYQFSICFENTSVVKDYISEKIFDSFLAQTIPIYWGASNIEIIIPKECFIDFREFKSYDDLYSYINCMDEEKYMTYINAINTFLKSKEAYKYTIDNWINRVKNIIFRLEKKND